MRTPGAFVGLRRVGGAPNDGSERVLPVRHCQPLQTQSPAGPVDFTAFRGPPGQQAVHDAQVRIDRVAVAAGLAVVPNAPDPFQGPAAELPTSRGWPPSGRVLIEMTKK
jgi:hypothetical protein